MSTRLICWVDADHKRGTVTEAGHKHHGKMVAQIRVFWRLQVQAAGGSSNTWTNLTKQEADEMIEYINIIYDFSKPSVAGSLSTSNTTNTSPPVAVPFTDFRGSGPEQAGLDSDFDDFTGVFLLPFDAQTSNNESGTAFSANARLQVKALVKLHDSPVEIKSENLDGTIKIGNKAVFNKITFAYYLQSQCVAVATTGGESDKSNIRCLFANCDRSDLQSTELIRFWYSKVGHRGETPIGESDFQYITVNPPHTTPTDGSATYLWNDTNGGLELTLLHHTTEAVFPFTLGNTWELSVQLKTKRYDQGGTPVSEWGASVGCEGVVTPTSRVAAPTDIIVRCSSNLSLLPLRYASDRDTKMREWMATQELSFVPGDNWTKFEGVQSAVTSVIISITSNQHQNAGGNPKYVMPIQALPSSLTPIDVGSGTTKLGYKIQISSDHLINAAAKGNSSHLFYQDFRFTVTGIRKKLTGEQVALNEELSDPGLNISPTHTAGHTWGISGTCDGINEAILWNTTALATDFRQTVRLVNEFDLQARGNGNRIDNLKSQVTIDLGKVTDYSVFPDSTALQVGIEGAEGAYALDDEDKSSYVQGPVALEHRGMGNYNASFPMYLMNRDIHIQTTALHLRGPASIQSGGFWSMTPHTFTSTFMNHNGQAKTGHMILSLAAFSESIPIKPKTTQLNSNKNGFLGTSGDDLAFEIHTLLSPPVVDLLRFCEMNGLPFPDLSIYNVAGGRKKTVSTAQRGDDGWLVVEMNKDIDPSVSVNHTVTYKTQVSVALASLAYPPLKDKPGNAVVTQFSTPSYPLDLRWSLPPDYFTDFNAEVTTEQSPEVSITVKTKSQYASKNNLQGGNANNLIQIQLGASLYETPGNTTMLTTYMNQWLTYDSNPNYYTALPDNTLMKYIVQPQLSVWDDLANQYFLLEQANVAQTTVAYKKQSLPFSLIATGDGFMEVWVDVNSLSPSQYANNGVNIAGDRPAKAEITVRCSEIGVNKKLYTGLAQDLSNATGGVYREKHEVPKSHLGRDLTYTVQVRIYNLEENFIAAPDILYTSMQTAEAFAYPRFMQIHLQKDAGNMITGGYADVQVNAKSALHFHCFLQGDVDNISRIDPNLDASKTWTYATHTSEAELAAQTTQQPPLANQSRVSRIKFNFVRPLNAGFLPNHGGNSEAVMFASINTSKSLSQFAHSYNKVVGTITELENWLYYTAD